jgi:anthraniloyl-CoA monooxygenase
VSTRRIDIIGGGPAGLYAARLLKVARPDWDVTVHERMSGSLETFGFGVGLTGSTTANLTEADPESADDIRDVSHSGHGLILLGDGGNVDLHGARNLSIGRSSLLEVLARHAIAAGVTLRSGAQVNAGDLDSDVIIAADGVRSATREKLADKLGASVDVGRGMYLWCGSDFALDDAIFSPARTEHGLFVAHAYPYAPDRSTFLIEADERSWRNAGMDLTDAATADSDSDEISLRYLEGAFVSDLAGHALLGNRSRWLRFCTVHLERWSVGNTVLIGDAAHTAHYTLGSGTKLALEDAIGLSRALIAHDDTQDAFADYEQTRRSGVTRFQHLAARSQRWWESYYLRADQPLPQLAVGFMTRAGNIDLDKFAASHPDVVQQALALYANADVASLVGNLSDWILAQSYRGRAVAGDSRIIRDATDLTRQGADVLDVADVDPWAETGDQAASLARNTSGSGRPIWLRGASDLASVQGRIDLGERLKLEAPGSTVVIDIPSAARPDAVAGLVAGRCDLVRFT